MFRSTTLPRAGGALIVAVLAALAISSGAGAARSSASCGVVAGAGHSWIVVVKGISCSRAVQVVRGLSARTASIHAGTTVTVHSPLAGYTCVLASHGKPGGGCSTAGAAKSILWLSA